MPGGDETSESLPLKEKPNATEKRKHRPRTTLSEGKEREQERDKYGMDLATSVLALSRLLDFSLSCPFLEIYIQELPTTLALMVHLEPSLHLHGFYAPMPSPSQLTQSVEFRK